jgi:hypothetical protein
MTEALYTNDTALKMIRIIGPNFDSESTVCACSLDTGFLFESGGGARGERGRPVQLHQPCLISLTDDDADHHGADAVLPNPKHCFLLLGLPARYLARSVFPLCFRF